MPRNAEPEIIEQGNAACNGNARVQYRRRVNHLMPSSGDIKERRLIRDGRYREDRENQQNGNSTEQAFVADSDQRGN